MSWFDRLRTQKFLSFSLVLFTLAAGIVIGTLINTSAKAAKDQNNEAAPGATALEIPNPVALSNVFSQIAKQVQPSVVNISTVYNPKPLTPGHRRRQASPNDDDDQNDNGNGGSGSGGGMDEFFYRFFGNPLGNGTPEMQRKSEAVGSGVVVDPAGYILTNNHVVDKADIIKVKFLDDPDEYTAKVIGVDAATDLAVIHVAGKKGVFPAKIGNSDAVQVGDWALAIGSPFSFQETVTAGIISAKERTMPDREMQFQHFLQTDAAINPGNSGGPLLNVRGEVIGINTAIVTHSGGYQGIGFALPINTAANVYNQIIKYGKVTRGSIGIQFTASDDREAPALLKSAGVSEGVFVQTVTPGGPSEKAGLKDGDVIVAINGKPVHNGDQLVGTVTATPVGNPLDVTVVREGKHETFKVVVGDLGQIFPDHFGAGGAPSVEKPEETKVSFGMSLQGLTEQRRQQLSLKEKGGVEITEVEPNSFAEDVGLAKGLILLAINHQAVSSIEDVRRIQATLKPGDTVQFRVLAQRNDGWTAAFLAGVLPVNAR